MTNINLTHAIANIDAVLEAAKRIKGGKKNYDARNDAERRARDAIRELQNEAHAVTTAMVDGDDMADMRDLATIQKAMQRANVMLDRALERRHTDHEAMEDAFDVLARALSTDLTPVQADDIDTDTDEQEAA